MKMWKVFAALFLLSSVLITGGEVMALELKSSSFKEGGSIPPKYTCKGEDVSPPLSWDRVPDGTKSLALICDDPDAPFMTWVHWVVYNIPAGATRLGEAVPKEETLSDGTMQGLSDFRRIGYGGPCPPAGGPHRYYFKLYALGAKLDLKPGATKKELLKAMEGHVLQEAELMGKFKR